MNENDPMMDPEAIGNLPGARGTIALPYESVAAHGDPIQVRNYKICENSRYP